MPAGARSDTCPHVLPDAEVPYVTANTPVPPAPPPAAEEPPANGAGSRIALLESIMDNLSAWTVIAAAISFLYLVWATLEIMSHYVGGLPKVTP